MRSGWYERIEYPRINEDWVKLHCKNITRRERELLRIINYRKLVRRDHLEILSPDYRTISMRTNVLNRSIKKLFEKSCIDKVHEEPEFMTGNLPAIVAVDRAGAIILGTNFKQRIKHIKRIINNETKIFREIPPNYPHLHGINKLEVDTTLWALERGYKFKWYLEQNNKKTFSYNGEDIGLIPDVFLILNTNPRIFLFFLEYDTGTEDNRRAKTFPTLLEKMEKYQKYKAIGAWKDEWWAKKINAGFPLVLFITDDDRRIDFIKERGSKIGLHVDAVYSSNYIKKLDSLTTIHNTPSL
jgi:hypothetical protein